MKMIDEKYKLANESIFGKPFFFTGIAALAISATGFFLNSQQFFYSYLVAYIFWLSIALGGLFFVMLHHVSGAEWSIVLRRIAESVMISIPFLALFFIPIVFGIHDIYHWSHSDLVVKDELLTAKSSYLNITFFIIRSVIYFGLWFLLARSLYRKSIEQDSGDGAREIKSLRRISAPGIVVFAVSITFAAFDWLMSLDAHWYSTIFGVYVFAGSLLSFLAFLIIVSVLLRKRGILSDTITVEHYHDLGKFLFSFTIFWGYIAFSQYFLIWYANIPEETIFYGRRWEGTWKIFTMALVIGHFLIPFFGLMPRAIKRNLNLLSFFAAWILVMHWIDLYWLALPNLHADGINLSFVDLTLFIGIGGIFIWYMGWKLKSNALVPVNDPGLEVSLKFTNN